MERVTGIGGLFFRSEDPTSLSKWYEDHLGINVAPTDLEMEPWVSAEGVTVFAPFKKDTDYFSKDFSFMLNFRVNDLAKMLDQLKSADIDISREEMIDGIGKFARIHDPEGNPIELWEPA